MENNYHLSNKKAIFYNMKVYYEAIGKEYHHYLPLTFHIKEGLNDPQFLKFEQLYHDAQDPNKPTILDQFPKFGKTLWIVNAAVSRSSHISQRSMLRTYLRAV